ncbi:MAG: 16S rRNA (guanine(966)-N(2))-methyltransferase RsmD [Lachnospiraceae bacterium]|nr:16S rRNA (guanine(966)-N(2))-methyltransferase RsmD [Lachnospiraceae bacterium]
MRVIAGKCRSLQLKTPKGVNTRPTLDRIKETLFNIIQNEVPGAVVADIFAGSGALGIEALSRGASKSYFIDNDTEALKCIEDNLAFTKLKDSSTILKGDVFTNLSRINAQHLDIIFIDPPYESGYEQKLFDTFKNLGNVDTETLIILESAKDMSVDFDGFDIIKTKEYKTNKHTFLRRKP